MAPPVPGMAASVQVVMLDTSILTEDWRVRKGRGCTLEECVHLRAVHPGGCKPINIACSRNV
eukprot:7123869-Pyramimonas_sp.AAC.1